MMPDILPGHHASIFRQDSSFRNEYNDGVSSIGSWETTISSDDAHLGAPLEGFPKASTMERNSPLGHLHSYDYSCNSVSMPVELQRLASLQLDDGPAFLKVSRPLRFALSNVVAFSDEHSLKGSRVHLHLIYYLWTLSLFTVDNCIDRDLAAFHRPCRPLTR